MVKRTAAVEGRLRPVDLGRAIGLSAQQARRYEQWGFIPAAERSPSGRRRYGERHRHAILAVRAMQAGYGWKTGGSIMRLVHGNDLAGALALVDAQHAALVRRRQEVEATLAALRVIAAAAAEADAGTWVSRRPTQRESPLRVGAAAERVGVRPSALRFWEEQGLLRPVRERSSGYRVYEAGELARLRVVAVLREAGYPFAQIRAVLDELDAGRPSEALSAIERRREELTNASGRCSRATAAFWGYVSDVFGMSAAFSRSLQQPSS